MGRQVVNILPVVLLLYGSYFMGLWRHLEPPQVEQSSFQGLRGKTIVDAAASLEKESSRIVDLKHDDSTRPPSSETTDRVHTFYYPWYRSVDFDGGWKHWDHEHLEHWEESVRRKYPKFRHNPSLGDIGASYYPVLGAYSSADPLVMERHMQQLRSAKIGVLVVSWLPASRTNTEDIDELMIPLLDTADRYGLKMCLHLEPYPDRSATSVKADVLEALDRFTSHAAYYHLNDKPVFYAYDSYQISARDWGHAFRDLSPHVYLIALILSTQHLEEFVLHGPFDAGYSYFGAKGFTRAATPSSWNALVQRAHGAGKRFIPCVAPGYNDLRVRPWNTQARRDRNQGQYYDDFWSSAIAAQADIVAITSFNEWHEGTQIEEAQSGGKITISRQGISPYADYGQDQPASFYLDKTRAWISEFLLRLK